MRSLRTLALSALLAAAPAFFVAGCTQSETDLEAEMEAPAEEPAMESPDTTMEMGEEESHDGDH